MMIGVKRKAARPPQRRLSSEEARELILAATEKRLLAVGPGGLRLQEIAKDVGLSHPTVLHHVGSREELVAAVLARSTSTLEADLARCFASASSPMEIVSTLDKVDEVMRSRGQARLLAWLALSGAPPDKGTSRLGEVANAVHMLRERIGKGAPFEDTAFAILLVAATMFGASLIGPAILSMLDLPEDETILRRFREWFAALLLEHADVPMLVDTTPTPTPTRSRAKRVR
jgi:AcrR family transcriptional regulator